MALNSPTSAGLDGAQVPSRILVVDDSVDNADMLADLLTSEGHEVKVAYRGKDALERLDQGPTDVVFLDVGLPDLDGFEVASIIRRRLGKAIRLVALTGYGDPESKEAARQAGFDDFIVKPFGDDDIQRALRGASR